MAHIDWLSFTFQGVPSVVGQGGPKHEEAVNGLLAINPTLSNALGEIADLIEASGRAPFRSSLRSSGAGVAIFFEHKTGLCLVEFSGQGCHWLRERGLLENVVELHFDRMTRIDIAHDWQTDINPGDFAELRDKGRFKSIGNFESASGQTVYVGSKTSERYARVYRYHEPHPRSGLMRLEVVLKKDAAKAAAQYINAYGVHLAMIAMNEGFKWSHPLWEEFVTEEAPKVIWRPRERGGSTLRWLYKQVLPAVEKTLQNGDLDGVREWIDSVTQIYYDYDARFWTGRDQYRTSTEENQE